VVLNPSDSKAPAALRWFVAITPLAGAMAFPLVVPLVMARVGIGAGVGVALVLSGLLVCGDAEDIRRCPH